MLELEEVFWGMCTESLRQAWDEMLFHGALAEWQAKVEAQCPPTRPSPWFAASTREWDSLD
jgi:hypothetical protein